ncbi:MAG TPA: sulfate ABC transporter ATP-binding protein [Rhodospirillaceae bacterium]|nr:sulfate ABC transporter ATP-binding protein [Rhodospirillaceae bacterium]
MGRNAAIEVRDLRKAWGDQAAVDDISFTAPAGEFTVLLGPSGCGKSTTLRLIAGLEDATSGTVMIGGETVTNKAPNERQIAMVFQSYALFPHLNVAENILFGLKVRRVPAAERAERLQRTAALLGLDTLLDRRPSQISGGQQQRVALGRAIIAEKPICLMDEPLSNLDAKLRVQMRAEIASIQHRLGVTTVYVTHDQEEALELSDRVVVMSAGQIEQVDRPQALYARPVSQFVFDFLGHVNVLAGEIADQRIAQRDAWIRLPEAVPSGAAQLYLRPHEVRLQLHPVDHAYLPLQVESISLVGAEVRLELRPCGWDAPQLWEVGITHAEYNGWQPQRGDRCFAVPDVGHLFRPDCASPGTFYWG